MPEEGRSEHGGGEGGWLAAPLHVVHGIGEVAVQVSGTGHVRLGRETKIEYYHSFMKIVLRIRYPVPFITPGSGILNKLFPDPRSQNHNFESLVTILWKRYYDSL